jgi:DNA-binding response OmpR family regulator
MSTALLVEDDDLFRAAIKNAIQKKGWDVIDVSDFPDAADIIDERLNDIDVLITDFDLGSRLSFMNGADIIWYLGEKDKGKLVKTILFSGLDRRSDPSVRNLDIDYHITKDKIETLLTILEDIKNA